MNVTGFFVTRPITDSSLSHSKLSIKVIMGGKTKRAMLSDAGLLGMVGVSAS